MLTFLICSKIINVDSMQNQASPKSNWWKPVQSSVQMLQSKNNNQKKCSKLTYANFLGKREILHPQNIELGLINHVFSHFNWVWIFLTPWTVAREAPLSLGFSRQEHWSGLPFPSPMQESEKWKWSCSVVSNSQWPHGLQPTRLLRPWYSPGKSTGVGCHCFSVMSHKCIQNCFP